jgi:hypothetical protein
MCELAARRTTRLLAHDLVDESAKGGFADLWLTTTKRDCAMGRRFPLGFGTYTRRITGAW